MEYSFRLNRQMVSGHHAFLDSETYILYGLHDITGTGFYFDPLTMFLSRAWSAILAMVIGIPLLSRLRGDYFALEPWAWGNASVVFSKGGSLTGAHTGLFLPASVYTCSSAHYFTGFNPCGACDLHHLFYGQIQN